MKSINDNGGFIDAQGARESSRIVLSARAEEAEFRFLGGKIAGVASDRELAKSIVALNTNWFICSLEIVATGLRHSIRTNRAPPRYRHIPVSSRIDTRLLQSSIRFSNLAPALFPNARQQSIMKCISIFS